MPAVDQLCEAAGIGPTELGAVAVDVGPGLFTGLRVGISAANSIALARGLPVVGVTSLETLAHPHRRSARTIVAVVDARRSEVYWAAFATTGAQTGWALREISAPGVCTPATLAEHLGSLGEPLLLVGDGAQRYCDVLGGQAEIGPLSSGAELWPSPLVVAELAFGRLRSSTGGKGPARPGALAEPLYLRQADVRIGWEQVGGRVAPPAQQGA